MSSVFFCSMNQNEDSFLSALRVKKRIKSENNTLNLNFMGSNS